MSATGDFVTASEATEERSRWSSPMKRPLYVSVSAFALAINFNTVIPPSPAWAVICENFGAGGDPAGIDGGDADNTACGVGSDASGTGLNSAYGNEANASGDGSANTA